MGVPEFFALAFFVLIPWGLVWAHRNQLQHYRFMKVLQHKAEFNARLLERVGSDPAAMDLLRDEAQRQLFDVKLPEPTQPEPLRRAVTLVQLGVIVVSLSVGIIVSGNWATSRGQASLFAIGTIGVSLGIGAFLAAGATLAATRLWRRFDDRG